MFYKSHPTISIVIMLFGLGLFIFFKLRKRGKNFSGGTFFSGKKHQQNDNKVNDLITLIMVQQLLTPDYKQNTEYNGEYDKTRNEKSKKEDYINKIRREVLELLEN